MPIKPENRKRYPENWNEISLSIRKRANFTCECTGECGSDHGDRCSAPHMEKVIRSFSFPEMWEPAVRGDALDRVITIILTTAHLDHTPENCDPENLRAFCQRCHLLYDQDEHKRSATKTRRKKHNQPKEIK